MFLSILISLVISLFILMSRYWSENYGYDSADFNVDSIILMALVEIDLFGRHDLVIRNLSVAYSTHTLFIGASAFFFQIAAIFLFTYATTYGLAGPASSMV